MPQSGRCTSTGNSFAPKLSAVSGPNRSSTVGSCTVSLPCPFRFPEYGRSRYRPRTESPNCLHLIDLNKKYGVTIKRKQKTIRSQTRQSPSLLDGFCPGTIRTPRQKQYKLTSKTDKLLKRIKVATDVQDKVKISVKFITHLNSSNW